MNIDLGYLGKVVLEEIDRFTFGEELIFVMEGYTESGIPVLGVLDNREHIIYPCVWRNAILIKV